MEHVDRQTLIQIVQSGVIMLVALILFFGLRGRIIQFAEWAKLPRLAFTPVRIALRYSILLIATFLVMGRWGFQVDSLLAVLGTVLGLIAIGFVAMWSVLSNLLCAFVLVMIKPFAVGDEVEILGPDGIKGRVIDLSLVFTTLEVAPGETVMLPNNIFFQRLFKRRAGARTMELRHQLTKETPTHGSDIPVQS